MDHDADARIEESVAIEAASSTNVVPMITGTSSYNNTHSLLRKEALGIAILLSNHEAFGFSERSCYHFELMETLTQTPERQSTSSHTATDVLRHISSHDSLQEQEQFSVTSLNTASQGKETFSQMQPQEEEEEESQRQSHYNSQPQRGGVNKHHIVSDEDKTSSTFPKTKATSCGVVSLLECVTFDSMKVLRVRKRFTKRIREFNAVAQSSLWNHTEEGIDYCHEPKRLPCSISFHTRVMFAYELTRMVFCIDASPTLTTTFGNLGQNKDRFILPIDRIHEMVRIYFPGLVEPVEGTAGYRVYDHEKSDDANSHSAFKSKPLEQQHWIPQVAITVIACYPPTLCTEEDKMVDVLVSDYRIHDKESAINLASKVSDWVAVKVEGDIASRVGRFGGRLDSSASSLRHIIDACDAALTHLPAEGRPCIVFATDCRSVQCDGILDLVKDRCLKDTPINVLDLSNSFSHRSGTANMERRMSNVKPSLTEDHDGPSSFALITPDDSEALYNACKCTYGYFLDMERLTEAVSTKAGNVANHSIFHNDIYFSARKRTLRPNALQWHTVFSLSPCCPLLHGQWGRMPSPKYMQQRRQLVRKDMMSSRVKIKDYHLPIVRVKGLLIMRIMDGFRPKRYGMNSQDNDKVSIQFALNLELGTIIHYELSFVSSVDYNAMVGSAQIKISISGEPSLIQNIKDEFENGTSHQDRRVKPITSLKEKASARIADFILFLINEDFNEASICSLNWDKNLTRTSDFITSLSRLDAYQLYRHFRLESFEVLGIIDVSGEQRTQCTHLYKELLKLTAEFSTLTLPNGRMYLKQLPTTTIGGDLTNYCMIEVKSSCFLNLFTVDIHFFEQIDVNLRLSTSNRLKKIIFSKNDSFIVAVRPLYQMVLTNLLSSHRTYELPFSPQLLTYFQNREFWDLQREPDLFNLIANRRCHFDKFVSLYLDDDRTILVKWDAKLSNKIILIQYHLSTVDDRERAALYIELLPGLFTDSLPSFPKVATSSIFSTFCSKIKERDEKCTRILESRRHLLSILEKDPSVHFENEYSKDLERLLVYSFTSKLDLRFFHSSFKEANLALENLTIDFLVSGVLPASVSLIPMNQSYSARNLPIGKWFLIKYDNDTLSVLHFPLVEIGKVDVCTSYMCRELTFFTVTLSALYNYDIENDDHNHISDSNFVTAFLQALESSHQYHYAYSIYLALRSLPENSNSHLDRNDFDNALKCCIQKKIISDMNFKSFDNKQVSKLISLFKRNFTPVPGASPYMFFHGDESSIVAEHCEVEYSRSDNSSGGDNSTIVEETDLGQYGFSDDHSNESSISFHFEDNFFKKREPIFIFISLNDKPMSTSEMEGMSKPVTLSVYITYFDIEGSGSDLQSAVASMLASLLRSFMADQTLEELLSQASERGLKGVIPQRVQRCLSESDSITVAEVPLQFFIPQIQTVINASTASGLEGSFSVCYNLLHNRLMSSTEFQVAQIKHRELFATDFHNNGWCVIHVLENGPAVVKVFHRDGVAAAEKVSLRAIQLIEASCYEVNQLLLLDDMHKTRQANDLLICGGDVLTQHSPIIDNFSDTASVPPGYFQCQVVHEARFYLNKHCSPKKALAMVKDSIFHAFVVMNRLDVFVYKDEDKNVYYMRLSLKEEKDESAIFLHVHGIKTPGSSITVQLDNIIKKKLLVMAVESISMSLAKSNRFKLSSEDVHFVESFQDKWMKLDVVETKESSRFSDEHFFSFPTFVFDPIMLLLYFRQNISGSSFFNIWHRDKKHQMTLEKYLVQDDGIKTHGRQYIFDRSDFSLCYNATRFQLDPQYQAISTLTIKGEEYSRKAGTGIALIEFRLLDRMKSPERSEINEMFVPTIEAAKFFLPDDMNEVQFRKLTAEEVYHNANYDSRCFCLGVKIHNTTLDAQAIYDWIELTLNQAVVSWSLERHLEAVRLGLYFSPIQAESDFDSNISNFQRLCPGLISLGKLLFAKKDLPHPAVKSIDLKCTINAPELIGLLSQLLEKAILPIVFEHKKLSIKDVRDLATIRTTATGSQLIYLKDINPPQAIDYSSGCNVFDKSFDNPHYISVYGLNPETEFTCRNCYDDGFTSTVIPPQSSLLFKAISVHDYLSVSDLLADSLRHILKSDPYMLLRRITFVVSMRRNGLSVLFYNLNPQLVETVKAKLSDIILEHESQRKLKFEGMIGKALTRFGTLSKMSYHPRKQSLSVKHHQVAVSNKRLSTSKSNPISQISPIREDELNSQQNESKRSSILMPTIVGKSIDGSAQQAALLSRARARITPKVSSKKSSKDSIPLVSKPVTKIKDSAKQDTEESIFFPPSLKKEFLALHLFIATRSLRLQSFSFLSQNLYSCWFAQLEGKELPFRSMETVLSHAVPIGVTVFPVSILATINPVPFLLYFIRATFNSNIDSNYITLSKNFVWSNQQVTGDIDHPVIYTAKTFKDRKGRQAYLIQEVSLSQVRRIGPTKMFGICRSWISFGSGNFSVLKSIIDGTDFFPRPCFHRREFKLQVEHSYRIQKHGSEYAENLQPSLYSFMFSLNKLRRSAMGKSDSQTATSPPALLREVMAIFPESVQRESVIGCWYRLLHRKVPCSLKGTEFNTAQELINFTRLRAKSYGIIDCTINETCLSGIVACEIMDTNFFVCLENNQPDCSAIYVLSCNRGDTLERFVFEHGNPLARPLSTHILNLAERQVKAIFTQACTEKLRERLWAKYAVPSPSQLDFVELERLRKISMSRSLQGQDPRLFEMIHKEMRDLGLSVADMINHISQSRISKHHFQTADPSSSRVFHGILIHDDTIFLFIEVDIDDNLISFDFVGNDIRKCVSEEMDKKMDHVLEDVVHLIIDWIWEKG